MVKLMSMFVEAGIGLVAYPFQGITKSLEAVLRSNGHKVIFNARLRSGLHETNRIRMSDSERRMALDSFDGFLSSAA